uniref:Uncharacterized protein n=1 Tax=Arundo donax TaxID=35708 RepID=A0A0A8ZG36_ARUDO
MHRYGATCTRAAVVELLEYYYLSSLLFEVLYLITGILLYY